MKSFFYGAITAAILWILCQPFVILKKIITYFKFKKCRQTTALLTQLAETRNQGWGKVIHVYKAQVKNAKERYTYEKKEGKDQHFAPYTQVDCLVNEEDKKIVTVTDFKRMKTEIALSFGELVLAILVTVVLIAIAFNA